MASEFGVSAHFIDNELSPEGLAGYLSWGWGRGAEGWFESLGTVLSCKSLEDV